MMRPGNSTLGKSVGWAILIVYGLFCLFPLWIMLKTAVIGQQNLYVSSRDLLPYEATLDNFSRVLGLRPLTAGDNLSAVNIATALRNSLVYTLLCVGGQVFFSSLAAYAFASLRFFGRNVLFFLFLSAMMIPAIVLFIPNFILVKELGWLNTMQGLVAPQFLMTPFAVFFLRQFFLSTPRELEEAARLDGASYFRTFWNIVLPVHKGAIATLMILQTVNAWNDFLWPFLVGRDPRAQVVAVALTIFRESQPAGTPDWTGLMAATSLSIIPVILLLLFLGRRVVESLQFSGLK
jgi:multiple sugar transport system permease protein